MHYGTHIPVRADADYPGQLHTDRRGEVRQGTVTTSRELIVFHASEEPIEAFAPIETCFYRGYSASGHVYAVRVPAGTEIDQYPHREVRFTLRQGIDIVYIGEERLIFSTYEQTQAGIRDRVERYGPLAAMTPEDYEILVDTWDELLRIVATWLAENLPDTPSNNPEGRSIK